MTEYTVTLTKTYRIMATHGDDAHYAALNRLKVDLANNVDMGSEVYAVDDNYDEDCDCDDRGWSGEWHDSQCPVTIRADAQ